MQRDNDAHKALAAEWNQDACADLGSEAIRRVGEGAVERDRERDIGVEGHIVSLGGRVDTSDFQNAMCSAQCWYTGIAMKTPLVRVMLFTLAGLALVGSGESKMTGQAPDSPRKCHGMPARLEHGAIHILHVEVLASKPTDGTYADDGYGQGEFDTVTLLDVLASPIQWKRGLIFRVHPFSGAKDEQVNFAPEHLTVGKRYYLAYTYSLEEEPHGDSNLIGLTRCGVQEDTQAARKQLLKFIGS